MKTSKLLVVLLLALGLGGCVFKDSPVMEEQAEIIQLSYVPSRTSDVGGLTPSMDFDGNLRIGYVWGSSTSPEVWAVVLRCEKHNQTFALKSPELYNKVKVGDKVTLKYVESYFINRGETRITGVHTKQIIFNDDTKITR